MRIGMNPRRNMDCARYTPVVLSAVTHLPDMTGYHLRRFEVVRTCLLSMRQHSEGDHTIIIWDNGSCNELREWLRDEYKPDILIEADNMGKNLARASIFGMMPPGHIVTYCDDDIYFYPNWLKPQIELLTHFPNVSSVSGYPVRTQFRWGNTNTVKRMKSKSSVKFGKFIPDEWEDDFCDSIGRDKDMHRQSTVNDFDALCTYNGKSAYLTAHHCQMIGKAGILRQAALNAELYGSMPDEKPLDNALDKIGNRLTTVERLVRHMGNYIDDNLRRDIVVK